MGGEREGGREGKGKKFRECVWGRPFMKRLSFEPQSEKR